LGETTTLTLAASKKASLRTTVPMSVVKQFGLKQGDKLEWTFEANNEDIVMIVKPVK
jgi:bifunctional DNA-binding transcriptional regulator/antitoxin component of YhaV-PrlF toxin-antitoxin module